MQPEDRSHLRWTAVALVPTMLVLIVIGIFFADFLIPMTDGMDVIVYGLFLGIITGLIVGVIAWFTNIDWRSIWLGMLYGAVLGGIGAVLAAIYSQENMPNLLYALIAGVTLGGAYGLILGGAIGWVDRGFVHFSGRGLLRYGIIFICVGMILGVRSAVDDPLEETYGFWGFGLTSCLSVLAIASIWGLIVGIKRLLPIAE